MEVLRGVSVWLVIVAFIELRRARNSPCAGPGDLERQIRYVVALVKARTVPVNTSSKPIRPCVSERAQRKQQQATKSQQAVTRSNSTGPNNAREAQIGPGCHQSSPGVHPRMAEKTLDIRP
ncbi:hypothetical protein NDU88_004445 [Pleurodeles waltl]|uniref:Secreted protein n=1 Tax=Pleurodeles waltl TaxID=8319 RepID=A0AAV7W8D4_PLEWA|nr:hypothetical protein NDU88_004445 [Pleurodeles waltl]